MASLTITITDLPAGHVSVCTDASPPMIGCGVTPAEALAMELLGTAYKRGAHVVYDKHQVPAIALALELLNPEGLGFAVTSEVRDRAREVLGRQAVERRQPTRDLDIYEVHLTRAARLGTALVPAAGTLLEGEGGTKAVKQ